MSIFNKFKTKKEDEKPVEPAKVDNAKKETAKAEVKQQPTAKPAEKSTEKPKAEKKEVKKVAAKPGELKGKTDLAHRILVKPLITEKASDLGVLNKYVFAVDSKANKVEIKKAIRAVYNVDPVQVNISNFSGKSVRYGRVRGTTKGWKKAVVTLKPGDKIEVYEGV